MTLLVTDHYFAAHNDNKIVLIINKGLYFDNDVITPIGNMTDDFRFDLLGTELNYEKV